MQNAKYVKVPIDVYKVKRKVFMGLTKRQVLSLALGAVVGAIPFFILRAFAGTSAGAIALFICAAPVIFCGFFEKNGMPMERFIKLVWQFYTRPRKVLYKSHNTAEYCELINEKRRLKRRLKHG